MKTLPEEAEEALAGRAPILAGAARFSFGETYRVWSGYGQLTIDSQDFKGIGARALIVPTGSQGGGSAEGTRLTLSGVDPDVAQTIEDEDYHQKPCTIWRLIFSPDHVLLGAAVFLRGRVDTVTITEQVGGDSSIEFDIEGPRRDMSRRGARIRSDSDQRVLGGSGDAAMKHISYAARKTLVWGQKPATAGQVLGGTQGSALRLLRPLVF